MKFERPKFSCSIVNLATVCHQTASELFWNILPTCTSKSAFIRLPRQRPGLRSRPQNATPFSLKIRFDRKRFEIRCSVQMYSAIADSAHAVIAHVAMWFETYWNFYNQLWILGNVLVSPPFQFQTARMPGSQLCFRPQRVSRPVQLLHLSFRHCIAVASDIVASYSCAQCKVCLKACMFNHTMP